MAMKRRVAEEADLGAAAAGGAVRFPEEAAIPAGVEDIPAAEVREAVDATRRSLMLTARRCYSACRRKPVAAFLKCPRRKRSTIFTSRFPMSCATSTASDIPPTAPQRMLVTITRYI